MNRKKTEEIKESIKMCTLRLKTIQPHLTDEKVALNESFNKLLIEKAILKEQLKHKEPSFLSKLIKKLNNNKKVLICDYFK